jgi:UPF0271 protein
MIDLSCDLGEATTEPEQEVEAALWPLISAANVACGGHVGDEGSMRYAVERARKFGVVLGAHPSYPDRAGFGRTSMTMEHSRLVDSLTSQIGALREIALAMDVRLIRVKPHGALYNDAHHDARLARAVVEAVRGVDSTLALVAAPGSALLDSAREQGLTVIREAFADRRYRKDGSLVPRSHPDALLMDPEAASAQAVSLVRGQRVETIEGAEITVDFDTLCVHGDMPGSVERLRAIRAALEGLRL